MGNANTQTDLCCSRRQNDYLHEQRPKTGGRKICVISQSQILGRKNAKQVLYIFLIYTNILNQVKVTALCSNPTRDFGFLSCKEAIQLAFRTSLVLLGCPLLPEKCTEGQLRSFSSAQQK
ncbi:uncharacterized protein LOC132745679 [Ruditapes philippinarum]|uniref:uncharacterized protein LOC132745679 n=1 Tax=Ruditapes philippinarum TaxID=129788 RepID=UPI00295BD7B0|nr:uncharacterized protein LOC132745679 [Ruditapes philippinarum]